MPDALPRHPRSEACRLCLVTNETMKSIFSEPSLVAAIAETVQLKISEGDGLPGQACQSCIDQLNAATRFIQRCHLSDVELRLPLYKECGMVTELEVIATDGVEVTVEESNQEGNWACSLTPVKVEFKEEHEHLPVTSSNVPEFPEINLKAETIEHPLEIVDPLEEFRLRLVQVRSACGDISLDTLNHVVWNDDTPTTAPGMDWSTTSMQTQQISLEWPDNTLQSSNEFICKAQSLQPLPNDEWQNNSLQAYSNQMWQQHKSIQQIANTDWENKMESTGEDISLSEVYNSFNFGEDGVFIESNSDAVMSHDNVLSHSESLLASQVIGLSELSKNEELFRCHICSKTFTTHRGLSCHINMGHMQKKNHKEEHPMYTPSAPDKNHLWCSLCSAGFSEKEELVKHLQKHKGQTSYCCLRCNKGFHSQQALKVHIKTHAKEKRYKCTKCDKSFSLRSYFRVHELMHKDG